MFLKKIVIKIIYLWPFNKLKIFTTIYETRNTASPVSLRGWLIQKVLGFNRKAYWPMHHSSVVTGVENIKIGIGTSPGYSNGCYIQGGSGIEIGDYTIIAPNVGIISLNHDIYDYRKYTGEPIKIGKYCWIGMGATILPGVQLGDHTIVAAGAVVNKSFKDGYCIIGGVPAKCIKLLERENCVEFTNEYRYYGYVKA